MENMTTMCGAAASAGEDSHPGLAFVRHNPGQLRSAQGASEWARGLPTRIARRHHGDFFARADTMDLMIFPDEVIAMRFARDYALACRERGLGVAVGVARPLHYLEGALEPGVVSLALPARPRGQRVVATRDLLERLGRQGDAEVDRLLESMDTGANPNYVNLCVADA